MRILTSRLTAFTLFALLVPGFPAAPAADETGAVEGVITFKGQPLAEGKVSFHPEKGKPVAAEIKADGSFEAKGVPAGTLRVTVEAKFLPRKYSSPDTSGIRVEVKKGKQKINLELK